MDRPIASNVRYHAQDEMMPAQGIPPPEYEAVVSQPPTDPLPSSSAHTGPKCQGYMPTPPPYSVAAAELPTYEEAQRSKILEEEERRQVRPLQQQEALFSRNDEDILGTDFLFFLSFFVSFLFNWVGFLLLLCFCHTLAGRYGALAGFGLSLAKWTLIVKHSTDLVTSDNEWLWWIIMAFGILICARACLQYIHAKKEWQMLNPLHRERLFFFS